MGCLKRAVFALLGALALVAIVVLIGLKVTGDVKQGSQWIVSKFWDGDYFNYTRGSASELEILNMMSLKNKDGASILRFLEGRSCGSDEFSCSLGLLTKANAYIQEGDLNRARDVLLEYGKSSGANVACRVNVESTLVSYEIKRIDGYEFKIAQSEARKAVEKIRVNGGLVSNLRNKYCEEMISDKPEFFHAYVIEVAKLMIAAGGSDAAVGEYIISQSKMR